MSGSPRGVRAETVGIAILAALAILVPVLQMVFGIRLTGKGGAHDGAFAVSTLLQFRTEMLAGNLLPRWSFTGNFGLGSPIFFFYPPGAYYLATALSAVLPGAPAELALEAAAVLLVVLAVAACAIWVARMEGWGGEGWRVGVLAGACFTLAPYVALINPQTRLAFAEMAAAPLWPLAFLAVDAARGRPLLTIVMLAPVVAAFELVHIPSLILCAGLVVPYAALGAGRLADLPGRVGGAAGGVALGLAMAGLHLVPAALLQAAIPVDVMDFGFDLPLLAPGAPNALNVALLVPALTAAILLIALRRRAPGLRPVAGVLCLGVVLATPLATPLWEVLPPLHKVQFPWRLLQPVSLLAAATAARQFARQTPVIRRALLTGALLGGAAVPVIAATRADHGHTAAGRTDAALAWSWSQAREYTPLPAAEAGWVALRDSQRSVPDAAPAYSARARAESSSCVSPVARPAADSLGFAAVSCGSEARLPVFYFPGWSARVAGREVLATAAPDSGLVAVPTDPGAAGIVLRRRRLPVETAGVAVSLAGCLAEGALLAVIVGRRRRWPPAWRSER